MANTCSAVPAGTAVTRKMRYVLVRDKAYHKN